ncbi:MAG: hypothetical protein AAFX53_18655 [Bacteroidota bacterium]
MKEVEQNKLKEKLEGKLLNKSQLRSIWGGGSGDDGDGWGDLIKRMAESD